MRTLSLERRRTLVLPGSGVGSAGQAVGPARTAVGEQSDLGVG